MFDLHYLRILLRESTHVFIFTGKSTDRINRY